MKNINQYLVSVFCAILFLVSSCTKQETLIEDILTPTRKSIAIDDNINNIIPIIVDNATYGLSSSPFAIIDFTIEDEIIMLSTNYSGGCKPVVFTLVAKNIVNFTSNGTPIIKAKLILENDNKCSDLIKENTIFDLRPINLVGYSSLILDIEHLGQITYHY